MSDSDELPTVALSPSAEQEAVPASVDDDQDSAALAKLPVAYQIADIRRRLREGARRHASFRSRIEKLENLVSPRTTPTRALRVLTWFAVAALALAGWIAALDRFAKSTDLDDLEGRVRQNERRISEIDGFLKAKP